MPSLTLASPVGPLTLHERRGAIAALDFGTTGSGDDRTPVLAEAAAQLGDYFAGRRCQFTLPLAPEGSAFQRRLWQALLDIPYGTLSTYRELAERVGSAPRAVGGACGRNPIPIIIPCHRVVAVGGIGGYSGGTGLATKRQLLALENPALLSAYS